ncbi:ImmA/IrrE family metallo-endopeptidase [Microbacterium marinilacus]|uniref:IrrE N-terminal-like domain-containing protein n=1 Tax=Microbacterium marinilacus TaxID=415209 RepID=A0ABP7BKG2_9MICO|nr:ImmA/IrrE family metallo-endopeptidase [Microbacterium marinilacus]MBY0689742.1 ImmA/IrrE family metallo-endopeptidase [Microbacterium marinilacus]
MDDLTRLAAESGLEVSTAHLPGDLLGAYLPEQRRILLDARLTPVERRCVLAHELGHAHYGHRHVGAPGALSAATAAQERQADLYAARLLISADAYERAERLGSGAEFLADELEVTADLIDAYRQWLDRGPPRPATHAEPARPGDAGPPS